jgi:tetratricopeptide (TPR) repeat protein
MRLYCLVAIFITFSMSLWAQTAADNRLALEYYRAGEFDKAAELYTKLFEESGSRTHLDYLITSLIETQQYSQASRIVRQQLRRSPDNLVYYVDLGLIFRHEGQRPKADEQFAEAVKKLGRDRVQASQLGQKFIKESEYQFALAVFKKASSMFAGEYGFHTELATVYTMLRDYPNTVAQYLLLLSESEQFAETVQNRLQQLLHTDIDGSLAPIIRQQLIEATQKNPREVIFNEMLVWLFVQEGDYSSAYRHASSLDRRLAGDGRLLFDLGELALSGNDFATAALCFSDVIAKEPRSPLYANAHEFYLKAELEMLSQQAAPSSAKINELAERYRQAIAGLPADAKLTGIYTDAAQLMAYYAGQTDSAAAILEAAIAKTSTKADKLPLEMKLAECYLFAGDIWEANLIYARVEKNNPQHNLGHQAKLMRAKIAYYTGEFLFAEALLDVLKASTSKLISNDALELALLINDNMALDTSTAALQLYAQADLLHFRGRRREALLMLDSLQASFPRHSLADELLFKKSLIYEDMGLYDSAASLLVKMIELYPNDILGDKAHYRLGMLYETKIGDIGAARQMYRKIITSYQSSILVPVARERYRKLRGDHEN